jgi:hypothetical protein
MLGFEEEERPEARNGWKAVFMERNGTRVAARDERRRNNDR